MGRELLADKDRAWRGRGVSIALQTAWGMIGLLAGEDEICESVMRGAHWLTERQNEDGRMGRNASLPAPDSPIISTCATTCMRITFR